MSAHFIAAGAPLQSAPYRLDGRTVCDLEFADSRGENVKITVPFFIGLTPDDAAVAEQWPELAKSAA